MDNAEPSARLTCVCLFRHIHAVSETRRRVVWMGGTRRELGAMPRLVRRHVGQALDSAQCGDMHTSARPMKGPALRGVVEIVADFGGDAFRAAYIARLTHAVYVLHVFQKKSNRGAATPSRHLQLIERRLEAARWMDKRGEP